MKTYSTNEYAEKLGVTPRRVRQMYQEGKLNARKVGKQIVIFEDNQQ